MFFSFVLKPLFITMKHFPPPRSISKLLFSSHKYRRTPPSSFHILRFSATPSYPSAWHEEESRNVRVSVWWDFQNCSLPPNSNVFNLAHSITSAVRANGIKGPLNITAFGDVLQLSSSNQEALSSSGFNLTHIPNGNGGKNTSLLLDLMYWVSQNPPPAHLFLISGDPDFATVLHRLRMNNYNILLATTDSAPGVLCSSATIMWQWSALVKGESLIGKHFNHPPDGPYASWYGHYKLPLEDPFALVGQSSNVKPHEVSESASDMLRPIPKMVVKQIRNILNSYPKGVSAVDLRAELGKSNVSIDKDFFGYRKFSRFLLAMPQILKVKSDSNGQYLVHGILTKIDGENDSTARSSVAPLGTKDEGQSSLDQAKQSGQKSSSKESAFVKSSQRLVSEPKVSGDPTMPPAPMNVHELPKPYTEGVSDKRGKQSSHLLQEQIVGTLKMQDCRKSPKPSEAAQDTASVVREADKKEVTNTELLVTKPLSTVSEPSVFQKILKWWFGSENGVYKAKVSSVVNTSGPGLNIKERKETIVSDHGTEPTISSSHITANSNAATANELADKSEAILGNSTEASTVFNKITSWLRSWRSMEESDDGSSKKSQKQDSSSHKLFSQDSFWNDMKAFLATPNGSTLVLQAKTRSQMGQVLQRDGPPALLSSSADDLLQLVDMLISDKKWVEESASLSSPFKLVESAPEDANGSGAQLSSVSSPVASGMQLQSGSLRRQQLNGEKKCQNLPHAGVTQPRQKVYGKSKSDVLTDCKNLVQLIVKEHPEGYNIASFRNLFHERCGYPLDLQSLGYTKLATLLQIMPGIRVELSHIIPASKGLHASAQEDLVEPWDKLSNEAQKDEDNESPWDELGPLAAAVSAEKTSNSKEAAEKMKGQVHHRYELLSESDNSDSSDDETTSSANIERRDQRKGSVRDGSLLKILRTWHDNEEGSIRKSKPEIVDSADENVENGTHAACRSRKSSEPDMSRFGRQKKPAKSYSFVADPQVDGKKDVVNDVLGSSNKSEEK